MLTSSLQTRSFASRKRLLDSLDLSVRMTRISGSFSLGMAREELTRMLRLRSNRIHTLKVEQDALIH